VSMIEDENTESTEYTPVSDEGQSDESNALLSRLRLIEDQPLDTRAAAFTQVHDRLQARLEGSDTPIVHD